MAGFSPSWNGWSSSQTGAWGASDFPTIKFAKPVKKKSSGGGWWSDVTSNVVTGFIGHLASDAEHMALGMPAGVMYMIHHPIASVEQSAKATWHDWSPLIQSDLALAKAGLDLGVGDFSGASKQAGLGLSDAHLFLHQFYEHPLAPILDVASVLTAGAGGAAKAADVLASVGARSTARAAIASGIREGDAVAVEQAGGSALQRAVAKAHGSLNPHTAKMSYYRRVYAGDSQGFRRATEADTTINRVKRSASGLDYKAKKVSDNPFQRAVRKQVDRAGDAIAARSPRAAQYVGETAQFKRWLKGDANARKAAIPSVIAQSFRASHDAGHVLENLGAHKAYDLFQPNLHEALLAQARELPAASFIDPATGELNKAAISELTKSGWAFARKSVLKDTESAGRKAIARAKAAGKSDADALAAGLKKFGADSVTNDPLLAAQDGGYMKIVRSGTRGTDKRPATADLVAGEANNLQRAVRILYKNPTAVWKWAILGLSPRYFVNNFIGNNIMLGMALNPVETLRGMYMHMQAVHQFEGTYNDFAAQMADEVAKGRITEEQALRQRYAFRSKGRTAAEHWLNAENNGFAAHMGDLYKAPEVKGGPVDALLGKRQVKTPKFIQWYHGKVHELTDKFQRTVAANATIRRTPEYHMYNAEAHANGLSGVKAHEWAMHHALQHGGVRTYVRDQIEHTLGQYHSFTKLEQGVQQVVPFYSWSRAITQHTWELTKSQPYKVAMVDAISATGEKHVQDMLGQMPDFLEGAIPTSLIWGGPGEIFSAITGGKVGHRKGVLLTTGLNPYSSVADLVKTGGDIVGATSKQGSSSGLDSLAGQLNPILEGGVEQLTGKNLLTGAPIQRTGPGIANIYTNAAANTPQAKLLASLGAKAQPGRLYAGDTRQQLTSILGVPIRQVDPAEAAKLAGAKKKKRTAYKQSWAPGL